MLLLLPLLLLALLVAILFVAALIVGFAWTALVVALLVSPLLVLVAGRALVVPLIPLVTGLFRAVFRLNGPFVRHVWRRFLSLRYRLRRLLALDTGPPSTSLLAVSGIEAVIQFVRSFIATRLLAVIAFRAGS